MMGHPCDDPVSARSQQPGGVYDAHLVTDVQPDRLRTLVARLESLAARRLATGPRSEPAATRATRLADHLAGHVRVRAADLDAPLLVLLVGPTGSGKSTIFNTIVGRAASPTGVLRPTTREAVVLVHPDDRTTLLAGTLAGMPPGQLRIVEDPSIAAGLALIDAPDIDSVEHANRALADRLVEAADLCLFATTAARYADQVPWTVLERVRERGLPLIVIVNRLPPEAADRRDVLEDVRRLLTERGMTAAMASAAAGFDIVGVTEGETEPGNEGLRPGSIAPVLDRIASLRADREARIALATRALVGSLAGLGDQLDGVADDAEHEAIDVEALRRVATTEYERGLDDLRAEVSRGTFLREEALRHWQAYVGADQMTRFFTRGIGRVRGAIGSLLRPSRAPVDEVRAATTEDLLAVARSRAAEAARRTATAWSERPGIDDAIAADPGLWGATTDLDGRLRERLEAWIESIAIDIQARGRPKRLFARSASIGVNVLGTGVMLGTFVHTGGLTGAEVGVAAATAFLNQKLLSALFGEAAMVELIDNARRRLDDAVRATFDEERERFDRLLPPSGDLAALATDLRGAATDVRALPRAGER